MNCASNETLLAMMEKYLDEGRGSTLEQLMLKPLISSIRHKIVLEEEVKQLTKERDEANSLVRRILSEINCRIEHGADSNGHLEGLYGLYKKETE